MKNLIILLISLMTGIELLGQVNINGKIITCEGEEVELANVIVSPSKAPKSILASGTTDEKGHFHMNVLAECDSLILIATGMEVARTQIVIPNQSGSYTITVEKKTFELNEVIVKSKKVYSNADTINYNVASFMTQTDQTIADVLQKMPGITVSEAGQVSYQGKPIKNFYIEGLNLMKNHYGIATKNLDPNNIATVQVFENHQDIKALKGIRPEEQASINLRLKKGVKGVFNLIATIGGGYGNETLWNNTAMATYFRRNNQMLCTYKGNNTGEDLSQELHSFDTDASRTCNVSSVTMPSTPGIEKRFYYLNRSHNSTFNNVYRIGKSGELGINAAYLIDRDTRQCNSTISNFLPGGSVNTIEEMMSGTSHMQKAYGDIAFINNTDKIYLKEQLKVDWCSTSSLSNIITSDKKVIQNGNTDTYRLVNNLHLTRRDISNRGFEVISFLNLEKRPHTLSVTPNLFPEILNDDMLHQSVCYSNFTTENKGGLLSALKIGNLAIHPNINIDFQRNTLESGLQYIRNNLALDNFSASVNAEVVLGTRHFHASLFIPLKLKLSKLKNNIEKHIIQKRHLHMEPSLNLNYKINSSHNLKGAAALSYMTPSVLTLYPECILTSYRQLSSYEISGLFEGNNLFSSIGYNFKNILDMCFASFEVEYTRQYPEVLYGTYFDGIVQKTISRKTVEAGQILSTKIEASKGFDWRRLKLGASIAYTCYDSPLLVQNEILRYSGHNFNSTFSLSLSPFKWCGLSYQGNFSHSRTCQRGAQILPWLHAITNKATIDFPITGGFAISASLYHYFNSFNDGDKSFLLLNSEAKYTYRRVTFSLSCDNLLNKGIYLYSSLYGLTESREIYTIRPRSLLLKIRFRIF